MVEFSETYLVVQLDRHGLDKQLQKAYGHDHKMWKEVRTHMQTIAYEKLAEAGLERRYRFSLDQREEAEAKAEEMRLVVDYPVEVAEQFSMLG